MGQQVLIVFTPFQTALGILLFGCWLLVGKLRFLPVLAAFAVFGMIRLVGLDGAALGAELVVIMFLE